MRVRRSPDNRTPRPGKERRVTRMPWLSEKALCHRKLHKKRIGTYQCPQVHWNFKKKQFRRCPMCIKSVHCSLCTDVEVVVVVIQRICISHDLPSQPHRVQARINSHQSHHMLPIWSISTRRRRRKDPFLKVFLFTLLQRNHHRYHMLSMRRTTNNLTELRLTRVSEQTTLE